MKPDKASLGIDVIADSPGSSVSSASSSPSTSKRKKSTSKSSKKRKSASVPHATASGNEGDDIYEVEKILEHNEINGKVVDYKVKWKGWSEDSCTWEPIGNLTNCLESVVEYFEQRLSPVLLSNIENLPRIEALRKELLIIDENEWNSMVRLYLIKDGHIIPEVNKEHTEFLLDIMAKLPSGARDPKMMNEIRKSLLLLKLKSEREHQLKILNHWMNEINAVSHNSPPITVDNVVDLNGPPSSFFYIEKRIPGYGITIPENSLVGCECSNCPGYRCCARTDSNISAYGKDKLLKITKGMPIYECNDKCKCGPECSNRVVQNGRSIPLVIFKTLNRGWGVRTLEPIKKGQFVTEYVGEIITNEEAERRGRIYDKLGVTYLFNLDFNDLENYTHAVDAAEFGNVSHFINHSCSPNLLVFSVWIECLDPNLPRLALFASRNIKAGEEITFDYLCQPAGKSKRNTEVSEKKLNYCKCGATNCRKFLF